MATAITICLILFLFIGYLPSKMTLHIYEQFFIFFLILIFHTSFHSFISVNLEYWRISEKTMDMTAMRLYGIIFVPILYVCLLDHWIASKRLSYRFGVFLTFFALLFFEDFVLRVYDVYKIQNWNVWLTLCVWAFLFIISLIALKFFRKLLKKEGLI